jgi:poly-gamma-glutamate synthesis protein (capsule biosynthesis protein)
LFFSNNHLRDFPDSQIDETKKYVENAWLKFVWAQTWFFPDKNVYKKTIWNKELIVINVNDVVTPLFDYDIDLIKKYIKENKKGNTIVVIYMHWWREYELKADKRQIELWHKFIDYWADLVVWNHSHTIQNKEKYNWKMIYYSLWNLTYDSTRQKKYIEQVWYGLFLWVNFNNNKVDFFEIPYKIEDRKPVILIWDEKKNVLDSLK